MTDGSLAERAHAFAMDLPEAWEDHPWGETVYKVGKKVFVFFGIDEAGPDFHLTAKLRDGHEEALTFEWVEPSGYGLGKAGWITATVPDDAPLDLVLGWILESYLIVAPKRLAAQVHDRP
jgi:predicted DNA-binding protein (MmcQ/YjbR family)